MFSLIVAIALVDLPSPAAQRSIWTEISVKRTGSNGYEEYLDAVDEFRKSGIAAILNDLARADVQNPTQLQLCRIVMERSSPVLAKLQAGNLKTVFEPITDVSSSTAFPQYAEFKAINKSIVAGTNVKFAQGSTAAAVTDILTGLEFSDNAGRGTLIGGLVSFANHGLLLSTLSRHWGQLSGPDSVRLESYVNSYFRKPSATSQILQFEFRALGHILRREVAPLDGKQLSNLFSISNDENRSGRFTDLADQWNGMSIGDRQRAAERAARELELRSLAFQTMLMKPEKEWTSPIFPKGTQVEGHLIDLVSPNYNQILDAAAKHRTQLRLLRLHALIRQYRFEHERLPENLSKLNKPTEVLDPMTGESFAYEPKADLVYELFSRGNERTGRIDLVYKRPAAEERLDPNVPP